MRKTKKERLIDSLDNVIFYLFGEKPDGWRDVGPDISDKKSLYEIKEILEKMTI